MSQYELPLGWKQPAPGKSRVVVKEFTIIEVRPRSTILISRNGARRPVRRNRRAHAQQTEDGIEYWLVRDLQHLLGYTEWRNFTTVISKARTVCEVSGHPIADHFVDVTKWSTWVPAALKTRRISEAPPQ